MEKNFFFWLMVGCFVAVAVIILWWAWPSLKERFLTSAQTPVPSPPTQPANVSAQAMSTVVALSPAEIRRIAATYQIKVSGTTGTTFGRWVVFLGIAFLALPTISLLIGGFVAGLFSFLGVEESPYFEMLVGAVWFALMGTLLMLSLRNVPKLTGLLTTNYLGGTLHTYGPGLHLLYPTEWHTQDDYIDVRTLLVEKTSRFVVKGGKEGEETAGAVGLTFQWTSQYGPFLPLLALYVRTEEKAIDQGFEEVMENAISEAILSGRTVDEMLDKDTVDSIQKAVNQHLMEDSDQMGNTLEQRFGIKNELNTLGPPKFDEDYEQALSGQAVRRIVTKDAKKIQEALGVDGEKAIDVVMILNKENVKKDIFAFQVDGNTREMAPAVANALRTVGPVAKAVTASRQSKPSRSTRKGGSK